MLKLKLEAGKTLDEVIRLPGLHGIEVDEDYGLVCISPKDSLFVIQVEDFDNLEQRKKLSPEIIQHFGDIRISTTPTNTEGNAPDF